MSIHELKLPLRDRGIIGLKFEKLCFLSGIERLSVLVVEEGFFRRGKIRQSNGGSVHAKRPIDRANPIKTGTRDLHSDTETKYTIFLDIYYGDRALNDCKKIEICLNYSSTE